MKMKTTPKKVSSPAGRIKASRLIGKLQDEQDQEDSFLNALSNLAVADPAKAGPTGRRSRFWFRMETAADYVSKAKAEMAPKKVEHVDQVVVDRLARYRTEMPPMLSSRIDAVREFFLTEIAPLTMASAGGAMQSREVASRLLDTEIDSAIFARFENMVNRAATIKMSEFVAKYFGLGDQHVGALLGVPQQGGTPMETEVKRIIDHLQNAPSRRDLKTLSDSVAKLQKAATRAESK